MKKSKHQLAVIQFARYLLNLYFTPGSMIEWEDIDEVYQSYLIVTQYRSILSRRRNLIHRGVRFAMNEARAVDKISPFLNDYSENELNNLEQLTSSFIESSLNVFQFRKHSEFMRLAKAYRFIPDSCDAADIELLHL